ncbi:endonuclease [Pseudomonas sp. TTU2014-080ASC]|uniref:endonuclease n=1 Tax=Pseudomonas sp. TTU2014-080ASC TaxID=1729724 RepID=UPI000718796A|nr:endonuclease [Pseudomonas sp. TTU2014-080ASC]KRW58512.1 deoxyribonuclease [Pseudomonas sp. TTU2014-080ASC]
MSSALLFTTLFFGQGLLANPPENMITAKQIARQIYAAQPTTFYCGCRFRGNQIDLASCGYQPRKQPERARRLEWEHVVPAWVIGHQRQCWKNGGRNNCSRNDKTYQAAEADLHNLVPSIGEVNSDRSNFALGMLSQKPSQYGACKMVVDFSAKTAMPPEHTRGAAARIYLYMSDHYRLRLSNRDRRTYEAWNRQYPVTEWERWRNQQVGCVMGHGNPYVGEVDTVQCLLQKVLSAR